MVRIGTLYDVCLANGAARDAKTCYMAKEDGRWKEYSYEYFLDRVEALGLAFHEAGLQHGDRVAILCENRPEWFWTDMAAVAIGLASAPIYPSYPANRVQSLLNDSGAKAIVVSNTTQLAKVLEVRAHCPALTHVIVCEAAAARGHDNVLAMEEMVARGRALRERQPGLHADLIGRVTPEDLATIIYTSGTTGVEKGAMLTHANFTSNVSAGLSLIKVLPTDSSLSFLPLSHVLERTGDYYVMLAAHACVAFAESVDALAANMMEVRPTLLFSVPRVLEKINARVMDTIRAESPLKQGIFSWAMGVGKACRGDATKGGFQYTLANKLVFGKIREKTGGRLRLVISGGAPLSKEIGEFFEAIGLVVLEGYGLTETAPVLAINTIEHRKYGTVGRAIPGVELRIASDGEILAKGPNVMKGYWQKPEATAEAIDAEGWFHTGDVGHIDADGFLAITDRKKDILILSTGKNVAPQAVEARFKTSEWVNQILVLGDKQKYVTALIVPQMDKVREFAQAHGLPTNPPEAALTHPTLIAEVKKHVDARCADLAQFERIKKFALLGREFTIDDGSMTPTLKLRRRQIVERFGELVMQLYDGSDPDAATPH